jgi:hypothetical protein
MFIFQHCQKIKNKEGKGKEEGAQCRSSASLLAPPLQEFREGQVFRMSN